MNTQRTYTPEGAAGIIGCDPQEVLDHIKAGRLKADFLGNVGDYLIAHDDLVLFLKVTRNEKATQRMSQRHIVLVDRDPHVVDIMRMELGRQGCEVRLATNDREISLLVDDFAPDVICVHLGAVTRPKNPIKESLERARRVCKSRIVLYHNWSQSSMMGRDMVAQIEAVKADAYVALDKNVSPLVEAVRELLGLKVKGGPPAPKAPPPPSVPPEAPRPPTGRPPSPYNG